MLLPLAKRHAVSVIQTARARRSPWGWAAKPAPGRKGDLFLCPQRNEYRDKRRLKRLYPSYVLT
jgi:hypothetical protein